MATMVSGRQGLVGKGREMYLAAGVRAHGHVPVCATRKTGVYTRAEGGVAFFAVLAAPVCYIEGEDDPVAFFEQGDAAAGFGYDAHVFVAEDETGFGGGAALVHV